MCDPIGYCLFISEIILTYIPLGLIISYNFKELSYIDKFENLRIKINFDYTNNRFLNLQENTNFNNEKIKFEEYLKKYNLKEGDSFTDNKDIKDALKQTYDVTITFIVFSIYIIISSFVPIIYSLVKDTDDIFTFLMATNLSSRTLQYLILTIVNGAVKGITTFSNDFWEYYLDNFFGFDNDFYNYYLVIFQVDQSSLWVYFLLLTIFNMSFFCIYFYYYCKKIN